MVSQGSGTGKYRFQMMRMRSIRSVSCMWPATADRTISKRGSNGFAGSPHEAMSRQKSIELLESRKSLIHRKIREKKEYLRNHPEEVESILKSGTEKAKEKASKTLKDVKRAMKINYFD